MSDFKEKEKGEGLPEENNPAAAESETDAKALSDEANKPAEEKTEKEELEELAALFQQELNKAKEQAEKNSSISDWDNLATVNRTVDGIETEEPVSDEKTDSESEKASEKEAEDEEETDESLCIRCGTNERKTDENGEYVSDYCEECEKARLKTHVSWIGAVFFILAVAVMIFAGRDFAKSADSFKAVLEADALRMDKKYTSAMDAYYSCLSSGNDRGYVIKNMLKCYEQGDQIVYASQILTQLGYDEDTLGKPWNSYLKKLYDKSEKLNATATAASQAVTDATDDEGKLDYDAAVKALDEIAANEEYDPAVVQYYRYYAASLASKSVDELIQIISANQSYVDEYPWLFLPKLATLKVRAGDSEGALALCDEMLKFNQEFADAYIVRIYNARMNKDYEKAISEADAAAKLFNGSEGGDGAVNTYALGEIYRQRSIACLLAGKTEEGIEYAEKSQNTYQSVDSTNLLGICYILNKDETKYKETQEFLEGYGYTYLTDVTNFKAGKVTLEEIFLEDGGELQ